MDGKLRNMASVYITKGDRMLLLFRQGGRVVNDVWVGSAGGHFEPHELNDARACVLRELEEELGLKGDIFTSLITMRLIRRRESRRCSCRTTSPPEGGECSEVFISRSSFPRTSW